MRLTGASAILPVVLGGGAAQGAQIVEMATARRRKNRQIIRFAVVFRSVQQLNCLNFEKSEY